MALLVAAAVVLTVRRAPRRRDHAPARPFLLAVLVAGVIGAYDGFFCPGTGTFLIMAYAGLFGDALDAASANAKVVNFASNLASALVFGASGLVDWSIALPMAGAQAAGGWLGAHVTVRRGQGLVRWVVIAVSLALVASLVRRW